MGQQDSKRHVIMTVWPHLGVLPKTVPCPVQLSKLALKGVTSTPAANPQTTKPAPNGPQTAEQKLIAELQAKIIALESQHSGPLAMKIGEKGTLSIYGLGKFPVSLYWEQWTKIFSLVPTMKTFAKANRDKLTFKHPETVTFE